MVDTLSATVRLLHILFAVAWVGSALLLTYVLYGGLQRTPGGRPDKATLALTGRAVRLFAIAGPLTLAFGAWNQYLKSGALSYQGSAWNVYLGASVFLTLAMIGINHGLQLPAHRKLAALPAGTENDAQAKALEKRLTYGTLATAALGVVVTALMVLATLTGP